MKENEKLQKENIELLKKNKYLLATITKLIEACDKHEEKERNFKAKIAELRRGCEQND